MRNSKFLFGVMCGIGLTFLISAKSDEPTQNQEIPRYHIAWTGGPFGYAYDAVTADYKRINIDQANRETNIKNLLAN